MHTRTWTLMATPNSPSQRIQFREPFGQIGMHRAGLAQLHERAHYVNPHFHHLR